MKVLVAIMVFALSGGSVGAQIDRLLEPIKPPATVEKPAEYHAPTAKVAVPVGTPGTLGSEAFLAELEKELMARLAIRGDLKLSLTRPWSPVKLPAADFAVAITEMPTSGLSGTFFLRVKVSSGRELVGDWQVPLAAQLWQDVWVASSRLDRGQPLSAAVVSVQKVDVLRARSPLVSAEIDPASLDLVTSVAAGRPLTRRDVVGRPVVRKGQVVEVVAQNGMLAISMKAMALENGATGEQIRLRNLESRREINGEVINENKVQIHF